MGLASVDACAVDMRLAVPLEPDDRDSSDCARAGSGRSEATFKVRVGIISLRQRVSMQPADDDLMGLVPKHFSGGPTKGCWGSGGPSAPRLYDRQSLPSFFLPAHYESNYRYPLIVWLHGDGQNRQSLARVMPYISLQNFVAVAPNGTEPGLTGNSSRDWSQSMDGVSAASECVEYAIEQATQRFSLHHDRVFLVGAGAGGAMALRLGLLSPERFAGVVSLAGALPRSCGLLRRVNSIRSLPLLLAGAKRGADYPEAQMCADLRLLHTSGCDVTLRQYPGAAELTSEMLADVNRWTMERLACGTASVIR